MAFGLMFLFIIVLSFTTAPFWMYYDLGISKYKSTTDPTHIVVMSGAGIPSESGLMRTYKTAELATIYKDATVIVTMPGDTTDTTSACYLMKKEIIMRGISPKRIIFENTGTNTRSQALAIKKIIPNNPTLLIVTSPEHLYRSIEAFRKVGFKNTIGESSFNQLMDISFDFNDKELGGNKLIPNIGKNTQLRYQFWSHLKLQVIVYREYVAIAFYKLKGWI